MKKIKKLLSEADELLKTHDKQKSTKGFIDLTIDNDLNVTNYNEWVTKCLNILNIYEKEKFEEIIKDNKARKGHVEKCIGILKGVYDIGYFNYKIWRPIKIFFSKLESKHIVYLIIALYIFILLLFGIINIDSIIELYVGNK